MFKRKQKFSGRRRKDNKRPKDVAKFNQFQLKLSTQTNIVPNEDCSSSSEEETESHPYTSLIHSLGRGK